MKDKQCLYPYIGITLEAFGEVRLCTSAMEAEFDLKKENIDLKNVLNHPTFKEHRETFSKGQLPETCRSCKKIEDGGVKSKREIFNQKRIDKYGVAKVQMILDSEVKKPLHLSIGFSNNCNLQCSMCSSKYSQLWKGDEEVFSSNHSSDINTYDHYSMTSRNVDELIEISEECSDIFIKGGEPFYSSEAMEFLKALKKKTHRPHIFIQTNGTILNKEVLQLVEDLNIEVGVSIDGVGTTYEWIRGFSYKKIVGNIKALAALSTDHKISLDHTTSIFNLVTLSDTFRSFAKLIDENPGIGHLSVFSIARQVRNNFLALPSSLRLSVLEDIQALSNFPIEAFDVLVQSLQGKEQIEQEQQVAREWVLFLEKSRGVIPSRENACFIDWINRGRA